MTTSRRRCFPSTLTILFILCSFLLLSPHLTAQSISPKREFRAAWIATVVNLDWPSRPGLPADEQQQELIELLDELQATGINAVIFQVRTESDALYDSPLEPWSYWLTGIQGVPPSPYYDPLTFAVDEAHKRGMELHAWFNPYRAIRPSSYVRAANHVTNAHPDWILPFSDISILDPGNPAVRQHVTNVVLDIVTRYDVDGLHADDYFYPYPPNQISNQDDASFAAYNPTGLGRADWRRNNVNLLLKGIYDSIQTVKPHVKFGMSPFGIWKSGVPSGIVGLSAYFDIYCDATAWLQGQYIDYLTPQLYWQIGGSQDYLKLMPWWSTQLNGRHLYPGHAPYRISSSNWTSSEVPNQIRANRARSFENVLGSVFFRAGNGITDNPKGFRDSLITDLYRHRALIPPMSWKDAVPPLAASNLQYTSDGSGPAQLVWDVPVAASDGDTASRYVVYRYDADPGITPDVNDPARILFVAGASSYDPPTPSLDSGSYYYAVTTLDRNHNEGSVTNAIEVRSPATPLAEFPADSAIGLPDSVSLAWSAMQSVSRYSIEIWDPTVPTGPLVTRTVKDTVTIVSGFEGQRTYSWNVRAENAGGASSYSSPSYFTTGFPSTPTLIYPADFTANTPVDLDLQWAPTQAADSYRIQVSKTSAFSILEMDTTLASDTLLTLNGLSSYSIYFWRVQASNAVGVSRWSASWKFRTQTVTSVTSENDVPTEYRLFQNYPNPFNPSTRIQFAVPGDASVSLRIYDLLGRRIRTLLSGSPFGAGVHSIMWYGLADDGSAVANGVYFYRLEAERFSETKRMILLR